MSEPGIIDIPEGQVNDLVVPGLFVLIGGGLLIIVHWTIGVAGMLFSLGFFFARSGVEIDVQAKRCRTYRALGPWKTGSWRDVGGCTAVHIKYYTDRPGYYPDTGTEMHIRTYDLHLVLSDGSGEEFHDFSAYAPARRCAELMAKHWSLTFTDEVQERHQRARVTTRARRY